MTENALNVLPALRRARDLIDRDYAEPLAEEMGLLLYELSAPCAQVATRTAG